MLLHFLGQGAVSGKGHSRTRSISAREPIVYIVNFVSGACCLDRVLDAFESLASHAIHIRLHLSCHERNRDGVVLAAHGSFLD